MRKFLTAVLIIVLLAGGGWHFLRLKQPPLPELTGALHEGRLAWDGYERSYAWYKPANLAANPAVVLVMHGSMGNPGQARAGYGYAFDQLADEYGFLVIYPQGYEDHFNGCRKQGPYAANLQQIDDVGFMRALVTHFVRQYDADPDAVFATGISNGGQMALRLAMEAPDLVAAVAPVVASMPSADNMDCASSGEAVAYLLMNGTDDPMNPYAGGTVALYGLVGNRGEVLSSVDSVTYWAELAGYTTAAQQTTLPDRVPGDNSTVVVYSWETTGRKPVKLYSIVGGGHSAPHPALQMPRLLGGSNNDIVAAEEIWNFFVQATAKGP